MSRLALTTKQRRLAQLLVVFSASVLVLAFATHEYWLPLLGRWLAVSPNPQRADAIVVLGGASERAEHAIDLYLGGLGSEVWYTGNRTSPKRPPSSAQLMAEQALAKGVPAVAIQLLTTKSTWEDGREVAALARERKVYSILVVTSWYHSRRALCIVRQHLAGSNVQVYYAAPADTKSGPDSWWLDKDRRSDVLREFIKLFYYRLRYGLYLSRC